MSAKNSEERARRTTGPLCPTYPIFYGEYAPLNNPSLSYQVRIENIDLLETEGGEEGGPGGVFVPLLLRPPLPPSVKAARARRSTLFTVNITSAPSARLMMGERGREDSLQLLGALADHSTARKIVGVQTRRARVEEEGGDRRVEATKKGRRRRVFFLG